MTAKRAKRGFTIVEMLMVIAVLAVLVGIVATAATSVIHKARMRKNEALRAALQTGIATFYQQDGYWPPDKSGQLQRWADDGLDTRGQTVASLDDGDYDALMSEIVTRCLTASGRPVMDVAGFTTTKRSDANKTRNGLPMGYGEEVRSWVAKVKASNASVSVPRDPKEMTFGYSHSSKGNFRRFVIRYNAESDNVTVGFAKDGN